MDLQAGHLAQHSRHPVDSESCVVECADKVVARGGVKGGSKDDGESTVAKQLLASTRVEYVPIFRSHLSFRCLGSSG